jgi:hypothetical protein
METLELEPAQKKLTPAFKRFVEKTGGSSDDWSSDVGRRIHINKLDALVCAKLNIYTVAHLSHIRATPVPEGLPLNEHDTYLIDHSENIYELSKLYVAASMNAEAWTCKESILNMFLTPFPKTDFERWGDANNLGSVARSWFRKDGTPLDVKIAEINELSFYCEEITIQDAIDFVMKYRSGTFKNPYALIRERVAERFRSVTSFHVKDYYLEHIINMCEIRLNTPDGDCPF